ncbi:hypothetical protein ACA910_006523 [Epithemia clementina (nom. ined.)]
MHCRGRRVELRAYSYTSRLVSQKRVEYVLDGQVEVIGGGDDGINEVQLSVAQRHSTVLFVHVNSWHVSNSIIFCCNRAPSAVEKDIFDQVRAEGALLQH